MLTMATCVCGQRVPIPNRDLSIPQNCPKCGRILEIPHDVGAEPVEIPEAAFIETPVTANVSNAGPLLLQMLLDPKSIERLLMFGGGLSVLGMIAWLISLGVFQDPRILAIALAAGTLGLLSTGWGIALRTRYRLAGQAVTFLACVLAPLNLWFYDAQNLLTIDGHLWVGGLVCSVLYILTVWKLRDPLFLYAVEAGVTMTVMLLLGDLHHLTHSSALCVAMVIMAAISIHAEAAFDPDHPTFSRRRFGLPLFFSGQVQLVAGTIGMLGLQILDWAFHPVVGDWCHSQLASTPWLAGCLWLCAAYLWFYSDLVVRKLSVYTYLASASLVFAQVTLLYSVVPAEVLVMTLSITAAIIPLLSSNATQGRWTSVSSIVGMTIGGVALVLGVARHFQLSFPIRNAAAEHPVLLMCSMLVVGASLSLQGIRATNGGVRFGSFLAAGLSIWIGALHGLGLVGVRTFVEQTPILMLLPLGLAFISTGWGRKKESVKTGLQIAYCIALVGITVSSLTAASMETPNQIQELFSHLPHHRATLLSAVFFGELALLGFVASQAIRARWLTLSTSVLFALVAVGKLLMFIDLPEVWYGPVLASIGIVTTVRRRLQRAGQTGEDVSTGDRPGLVRWNSAGELSFVLGQLVVFFQTLPWLFGPLNAIPAVSFVAVLFTAGVSLVGSCLAETRSMRGWHRFASAIIAASLLVAWIRTQQLADYQKLELVVEVLGIAWLTAGFVGRLNEPERAKQGWVSLALLGGSLAATMPVLICAFMHRWSISGPSLGDEIGLLTVSILMVSIGCILQLRSTTLIGGSTLGIYLAVLFGHLAYHPQVAIGVYIAAGGALIFLTGITLSIFRDRLLALPSKMAHREGVFRVMDWR